MVVFDPYDWKVHEDPYPVYRALRDEAPCYYNEELDFWALSRYDDVLAGFRDWQRLSNTQGVAIERDQIGEAREVMSEKPPTRVERGRHSNHLIYPPQQHLRIN